MSYIDGSGSLNVAKIARQIRQVAKSVDDTLYASFEHIDGERRLMTNEAIKSLRTLADEIERQEDEFFNS